MSTYNLMTNRQRRCVLVILVLSKGGIGGDA